MNIRRLSVCLVLIVALAATALFCSSCAGSGDGGSGGSSAPVIRQVVVVNWFGSLKDGASISWKLDPGSYKAEVTASNDGVTIEWVGASCPKSEAGTNFYDTCTLYQTGQVIITNPSVFGLGSSSSVTVKITKL